MTILLLGATGRTGKWILAEALERGHQLHALVRDKNKIKSTHSGLTVFEGTPSDIHALRNAIQGCDAVVSALNVSRNSDFPWSTLRTPDHFLSDTMKILIGLCSEANIQRIIITSAWGVADTRKDIPWWFRWFIDNSNIGAAYADHERQENLLAQSELNWTSVRPVGLTNGTKDKEVVASQNNQPKPSLTISRKGLASFILDQLESGNYIRSAVVVSH